MLELKGDLRLVPADLVGRRLHPFLLLVGEARPGLIISDCASQQSRQQQKEGLSSPQSAWRRWAMVKCLTDFSCWETIAKLAPIGTALIVLIQAIIALVASGGPLLISRRQ